MRFGPPPIATVDVPGVVRADGASITIDSQGTISSVGGGGTNHIQTQTFSGVTEIDFTIGIDGTNNTYDFRISEIAVSQDGVSIGIQFSTDGGNTYDTGNNYQWTGSYDSNGNSGGGASQGFANAYGVNNIAIDGGLSHQLSWAGLVSFFNIANLDNANYWKFVTGTYAKTGPAGNIVVVHVGGAYMNQAVVNALRLVVSAGTMSGKLSLYGYE